MIPNLSFQYGVSEIMDLIDGETSRHAAFLRFQDGGSAYDTLKIHTNEVPTVTGFIEDAFRTILTRFDGEGRYRRETRTDDEENETEYHVLSFYLPDFDSDLYNSATDEARRYVVISATARWLMSRSFGEYAKLIAADSEASMNRLIDMLRTRKFPLD